MTIVKRKCFKIAANSRLMTTVLSNLICFNIVFVLCACISIAEAYSQENENGSNMLQESAVRVFLDISRQYEEYIKTEIPFVNYVRDRKQAQVYIMVTTQETGSGGTEHTITFTGQQNFTALNDTLLFVSKQMDSEEVIRIGILQTLKMGLIRYVNKTPLAEFLSIDYRRRTEQNEVVDKWDYWVFNIDTNSRLSGEELRKSLLVRGSISADRVTPDWKTSYNISADYNKRDYKTEDETKTTFTRSQDFRGLVVKSISEHWSTGFFLSAESSIYDNIEFAYNIAPAMEYNVFPYSESTRREFRFLYRVGFIDTRYDEETIFSKMSEQLFRENLSATYEVKERWGSISSTLEGSHYFHDMSKNRIELDCNINLRLFEGLSLDLFGNVSRIRDQLSLPKESATEEEILLRTKQLATQYDYYASIGLRYTFGSIYSNVVNPRFGGRRRGGGSPGGFR